MPVCPVICPVLRGTRGDDQSFRFRNCFIASLNSRKPMVPPPSLSISAHSDSNSASEISIPSIPTDSRSSSRCACVQVFTARVCVHASGTSVCARRHVSPPFPNFPDLSASSLRNTCWRVTTDWPISLDLGLPSFKKRVDQRSQTFRARAVSYARIHTGCNAGVGREC